MIPPKRSIKIQRKLNELMEIKSGKCVIFPPKKFLSYRHALLIYHNESGRRISVRTTEKGVELWRVE